MAEARKWQPISYRFYSSFTHIKHTLWLWEAALNDDLSMARERQMSITIAGLNSIYY
jgi:hypothetical protein